MQKLLIALLFGSIFLGTLAFIGVAYMFAIQFMPTLIQAL